VELVLTRVRGREEKGAVAVLAAILFTTLFTVAALVVQFGFTRDVQQGSQNAADASALAAAYAVAESSPVDLGSAVSVAIAYAAKNFGTPASAWTSCSDPERRSHVTPTTGCVSFDSATTPTRVRVVIPAVETRTSVGAGAGVTSLRVSRAAEASVTEGPAMTCALCFLGPVDSGNADYTVTGGSIAVSGGVDLGSNGHMTATGGTISVAGTVGANGFSPSPPAQIAPFADPWASRTDLPPSTAGLVPKTDPCSATATGGQGIYGDFDLPKTTCTLQPGLYVIAGAWTASNQSVLAGTGVTLYFTCATGSTPRACAAGGEPGGYLDAKNGEITFSAPATASSTRAVAGLAIMYDRANTRTIGLQGNGGTSISGSVYAPRSDLDFNGSSCFGFGKGAVIVNGVLKANGDKSCVRVTDPVVAAYARLTGTVNLSQ
jgi:hypothetical protein